MGETERETAVPRRGLAARIRARTTAWAGNSETIRRGRERRYRLFMELCRVRPEERILDVGAGQGAALERFNSVNPIVAVDLVSPSATGWLGTPNVDVAQADGTRLPYGDREFPVAFSNSVIEHVPKDLQGAFASEVRRVAERYYVQTPNKWFPIEPHYQLPLVQFLPDRVMQALNRRFSFGWREKGRWEPIKLLSARELQRLFPDAEIHRERLFGVTKSLMAVRRAAPDNAPRVER
jgi:2-polyprenyl-3-methyl-5-hydroxy-6-metoxy-1,4-benzoquinol methylase